MNPLLKTTLIVLGALAVVLVVAWWYEVLTWPRAEDEPTNKDYDEL
jgi:hypothetical protein